MGTLKTDQDWINTYSEYILKEGRRPENVYQFATASSMEEADFYAHFASFEAIERSVFLSFAKQSIALVQQDENYENYNNRQRLLSLYYTLFELMTANRSFVRFILEQEPLRIKALKTLQVMRPVILDFVKELDIKGMELPIEALNKVSERSRLEGVWFQFILILQFWIKDQSPGFEKTDIFIEKSVNTSFDLLDSPALTSIVDLGRFLFKEKVTL